MGPAEYLAAVICVAAIAQWFAWTARVPSILFLLVVGFALGRWVQPDEVLGRELLFAGVNLAVGVILFEGSLSLRFKELREVGHPVRRLCSWTVLIAWVLITTAAWVVGIDWRLALLIGALLVVTGPTVINPILRQLRPTRRVASMLRWEGIVVDPIGAILAVLVFQAVVLGSPDDALLTAVAALGQTVLVAVSITLLLGLGLEFVLRRHLVPDFLQPLIILAAVVGGLVSSNALQPESGLLTVTLLGLFLGNRPGLQLSGVQEFKENLQVIFVGALFVMLAGRVSPEQVLALGWPAVAFVAALILLVRPASVLIGLIGTNASRQERILLAGMAPRGIVAAAVTSIFALELEHATQQAQEDAETAREAAEAGTMSLQEAAELATYAERLAGLSIDASQLVPLVFVTIVATVTVYGLGVGRLAERLGLATATPTGVLFVGAQRWVRDVASVLNRLEVPTLLITQNVGDLSQARMEGLRTQRTHVLSEYAVEEMDLTGIKSFVAATSDDDLNATAAREYGHMLGSANVFQLRRTATSLRPDGRTAVAQRLTARTAFEPPQTFDDLDRLERAGLQIRQTRLTDKFTLDDFRQRRDEQTVLLFLVRDGVAEVITEKTSIPQTGVTLVTMASPRPPSRPHENADPAQVSEKSQVSEKTQPPKQAGPADQPSAMRN